jgi:hypothetical protein
MVAGFFKILVVSDGGTDVEGELGTDNIFNGISKGSEAVKKDDLVMLKRGACVVNWDDLQDIMVNRVTFFEGCVHFGVVRIDVVIDERGNNKVAGRWIGNGEPVVRGSE